MRELWLFEVAVHCGRAATEDVTHMDCPDRGQSALQPAALCVLQARSARCTSAI